MCICCEGAVDFESSFFFICWLPVHFYYRFHLNLLVAVSVQCSRCFSRLSLVVACPCLLLWRFRLFFFATYWLCSYLHSSSVTITIIIKMCVFVFASLILLCSTQALLATFLPVFLAYASVWVKENCHRGWTWTAGIRRTFEK